LSRAGSYESWLAQGISYNIFDIVNGLAEAQLR
jgi:hypothetical protein